MYTKSFEKTILDLYCGTGFFSIALADKAKRVIGIELSKEAINDAKTNAHINNVHINYHDAKTEEFDWKHFDPEIVIEIQSFRLSLGNSV